MIATFIVKTVTGPGASSGDNSIPSEKYSFWRRLCNERKIINWMLWRQVHYKDDWHWAKMLKNWFLENISASPLLCRNPVRNGIQHFPHHLQNRPRCDGFIKIIICTPFVFYFKKIYFCTTKSYTAMVGYNRIPQSIPKNNKDILAKVADSKRKTSSPVPGTVKLPEKFSIAWK